MNPKKLYIRTVTEIAFLSLQCRFVTIFLSDLAPNPSAPLAAWGHPPQYDTLRNSADLEHLQIPIGFRTGHAPGAAQKFHAYISITQHCCCCCYAAQSRSTVRIGITDCR